MNALDFILPALKRRTPWVLEKLRDAPSGVEAIREWAVRYHLNYPFIIEYMTAQQARWQKAPDAGRALSLRPAKLYAIGVWREIDHPDEVWLRKNLKAANMPRPSGESLGEWLKRARLLYESRADVLGRRKPRTPRWAEFARRCDWFVQMEILGLNPSAIRKLGESSDRRAIVRGSNGIVKLLGGVPRGRPIGTPKRKMIRIA